MKLFQPILLPVLALTLSLQLKAQAPGCVFNPPFITIHFGKGTVRDLNTTSLPEYERVDQSCPEDGYYSYVPATDACFNGDWHTITEDHTPGDVAGNMMVVNAARSSGVFLTTTVNGFKGGSVYEFGAWLMNVCRITDKCPFPLLPHLLIRLQTPSGKTVAQFRTGDIPRTPGPSWTQHRANFTMPPGETSVMLIMSDIQPGGCGNDFALDDITFRECVVPPPPPPVVKRPAEVSKPELKPKPRPVARQVPEPEKKRPKTSQVVVSEKTEPQRSLPVATPQTARLPRKLPPPPPVLVERSNNLAKQFETEAGEIRLDLYDNGQIDGDTVSIYHNNTLVVEKMRLSQKPITFRITIDAANPHHELILVAENLGTIPPNTSLMIVTAGTKRYEVFISSSEQKNAKVVFDLKQ